MRFAFLVLIFAATVLSAAQVGLNPSIGINYAWFNDDPLLAPNLGLDVPVRMGHNELRVGLHYSPKGARDNEGGSDSFWLHYAEMPFTYTYYPPMFSEKFGLIAGYSVSFLLSASYEKGGKLVSSSSLESEYDDIDHGLILGFRYNQSIGKYAVSWSINYHEGQEIMFNLIGDVYHGPEQNRVITALVGFAFPVFTL